MAISIMRTKERFRQGFKRGKVNKKKHGVEIHAKERKKWLVRAAKIIGRLLFYPFFHLEKEGVINVPRLGAFVLLAKHQRWEDIPLLGIASPRPLYYVAKHELFRYALLGWFVGSLGGVPLNREHPMESRTSLRLLPELLDRGEGLVVFPEGTYYKYRMGPARTGIVKHILSHRGAVFVPVGIRYWKAWTRTRVRIRFGIPLSADTSTDVQEFLHKMMRDIQRLSDLC